MLIRDNKLRLYGFLALFFIFYVFFMLEMFFSWKDDNMWLKTFSITLLYTLAIWEPVRLMILRTRSRWSGLREARKRLGVILLLVIPYAFLTGFLRIYIEDVINLWGVPVANFTSYSFSVGISLLFSLLQVAVYESIYFFEKWNDSRQEAEDLRKVNFLIQFDSLKGQIQPHFLFNTLNTLIGLMKTDTNRAVRFTEMMAHVYRYLLEANERQLISFAEEMRFTKAYFFLLKTRFSEGLHLDIHAEGEMEDFMLPPLSLQILLENAVKHNVITSDRPLYISIRLDHVKGKVIVTNNLQSKPHVFSSGRGLANLKKRFRLLHFPDIVISQSGNSFSVILPLQKSNVYESGYYRR